MQHLYEVQMISRTGTPTGKPFLLEGLPFEGLLLKRGQSCYIVEKVMAHVPEDEGGFLVRKVDVKVDDTGRRYM